MPAASGPGRCPKPWGGGSWGAGVELQLSWSQWTPRSPAPAWGAAKPGQDANEKIIRTMETDFAIPAVLINLKC